MEGYPLIYHYLFSKKVVTNRRSDVDELLCPLGDYMLYLNMVTFGRITGLQFGDYFNACFTAKEFQVFPFFSEIETVKAASSKFFFDN